MSDASAKNLKVPKPGKTSLPPDDSHLTAADRSGIADEASATVREDTRQAMIDRDHGRAEQDVRCGPPGEMPTGEMGQPDHPPPLDPTVDNRSWWQRFKDWFWGP